jgi:Family of unknown function (DUF5330)
MFFLMRVAFWLCIVLALLPTGGSKQSAPASTAKTAASDLNVVEAFSAATATVSDMRHFCERQPEACTVGSQAAVAFGQRAQAGAKMVYEFINERLAPQETGSVGTPSVAPKPVAAKASQNTLTPKDLAAPWRGPQAPREAAAGRRPA